MRSTKKLPNSLFPASIKGRALLVFVLLVLLGLLFVVFRDLKTPTTENPSGASGTSNSKNGESVNLNPPTVSDKQLNDQHKDQLVQEQSQQVKPVITPVISAYGYQSGALQVGGYVSGVIENGGICTLTATHGGSIITDTATGIKNASNTVCSFSTPRSRFPVAGDWSVLFSYHSGTTTTGNSQAMKVTISP
jgi:hypothetical protein